MEKNGEEQALVACTNLLELQSNISCGVKLYVLYKSLEYTENPLLLQKQQQKGASLEFYRTSTVQSASGSEPIVKLQCEHIAC